MQIPGGGGWVYSDELEAGGELCIRLDPDGRVIELYLRKAKGEITLGDLKRLPISKVRARALSRPDLILAMMQTCPAPDVYDVVKRAFPPTWIPEKATSEETPFELSPTSPEGGLTDAFLRDVAAAYRDAVARGLRPNKALAEQTQHYSQRTVERWVYLARKKGLLEPTRPGSVG